jgi:5-methyltetrahydrofolate--homocysteine methyltransferase
MFDSTEWEKMEAGLQHAGGKCILNSTNYEDGVPRFSKVIDLAKRTAPALSSARSTKREWRAPLTASSIAKRAYEQATKELGFRRRDIFFDPLALPISTGIEEDRRNALETIEGIANQERACRALHDPRRFEYFVWSESRVARRAEFGVSARRVEAGLDAAIVNASKIEPLNRIGEQELKVARELIYDRRKFDGDVCTYDPLIEFTKLFEGVKAKSSEEGFERRNCRRASEESHHRRRKDRSRRRVENRARKYPRSTSSTTSCSTA